MKIKLLTQIVVALLIVEGIKYATSAIYGRFHDPDTSHEHWSASYSGVVNLEDREWKVTISEVDYGNGVKRIMHLNPLASNGKEYISYAGITGHDYDSDGSWDRIFYGGTPINRENRESTTGYNSVVRTESGGWKFEPCDFDKGIIKGFSANQILFAMVELDRALNEIRKPQHLNRAYIWNEDKSECEKADLSNFTPPQFKL